MLTNRNGGAVAIVQTKHRIIKFLKQIIPKYSSNLERV